MILAIFMASDCSVGSFQHFYEGIYTGPSARQAASLNAGIVTTRNVRAQVPVPHSQADAVDHREEKDGNYDH